MKKVFLFLAAAAMIFAGCKNEEELKVKNVSETEFEVKVPILNRAAMANNTFIIDRIIMQIVDRNSGEIVETITNGTDKLTQQGEDIVTTFNPYLQLGRTYDYLFWADNEGYYDVDTLSNVTLLATEEDGAIVLNGNDIKRDAFFAANTELGEYTGPIAQTVELHRPFAQVNLRATDIESMAERVASEGIELQMTYSAPSVINVATGEVSEEKTFVVKTDKWYTDPAAITTVFMDYIYVTPGDEKTLVDLAFLSVKPNHVDKTFASTPIQRNWITNLTGELYHASSVWSVEVKPAYGGTTDIEYTTAYDIKAANEAFANGATKVQILNVGEESTLYLPQTTEEVFIDFAAPTAQVTVKYGPAPSAAPAPAKAPAANANPAAVNITTNDITKFTVTGINNIVWLVNNQAALANALTNATNNQTVALAKDITMTGEWTPATTKGGVIFDGKNHVISGMTITDCGKDYAALIGFMTGGEVKNVTVKNANIVYNSGAGSKARGAAIVGISYGGTIENCHAENVSIKGYQKMGGVVGYLAQCNTQFVVRNCSAKNITFTNNTTDLTYQAGGLIGYTQNSSGDILVEGCSVSDITINNLYDGSEGANSPYYCGTFIGSLNNETSKDGLKVELNNNTISGTNTPQINHMYSNTYFGWASNPEKTTGKLATITIDGQEWTPNYPVKIVGGKGYATLNAALAAATAGQTVQILQAGEYATNNLSTAAAVVEATVDGVVFKHTTAATSWVASTSNTTVKNITWNVGNAHHQYFSNTNLENCTVNGLLCTHQTEKFKDCTFINEEGYNFWVYGNEYTEFDNCTFTCPGKNDGVTGCGSAINCYNEGAQAHTSVLVIKNCTFTAKEASDKYSAIYIKPETTFDIRITNSTCNDNFCTGAISGSKMWNLKADKEGTTVTIDGNLVYPFCSKDANGDYHIINAAGLLQFHDLYAAGKVAYTAKVYLDADIDFTGKTWTACDWHADGNKKGFALFDGQNHTIKNFTVDGQGMFARWACTANIGATPYFKNIVFDGAKNTTSTLNVSLFCGQVYQNAKIENVTIKNSQIEGTYKVAPFVGTVYDENVGRTATLTLKDCKVENTTVRSTKYNFFTCGMVAYVSDIEDNDAIVFEGNNEVKDVTLYKSNVSYNLFGKIYYGDGGTDGVAHDEAENVTVTNVNIVPAQ